MRDARIDRLARVLVEYSADVQPGQRVGIVGYTAAAPMVEAVFEYVLARGGIPYPILELPGQRALLLTKGSEAQLDVPSELDRMVFEEFEVGIFVHGETNTHELGSVDPARISRWQKARHPMLTAYRRRTAEGKFRWVRSDYPTEGLAQDADMSLREFEDFYFGACHVTGADDPVAYWQRVHAEQQRLIDWLKGRSRVEVRGPNVDLTLSVKDRVFLNADGHVNMPDGEIFTGPVEDSVNGWVRFTYPAVYNYREVDGVEITFEQGKAVKATARKNEAFLLSTLDTDPGARYLGEFAFATNFGITRFTRQILFDEKIGGTIHMAFGAAYPETGGKNESAVHWDMICDMRTDSEIRVDGELFYQNGQFKV